MVREFIKMWEIFYGDIFGNLIEWLNEDSNCIKGEIVLIVEGKFEIEEESFSL